MAKSGIFTEAVSSHPSPFEASIKTHHWPFSENAAFSMRHTRALALGSWPGALKAGSGGWVSSQWLLPRFSSQESLLKV